MRTSTIKPKRKQPRLRRWNSSGFGCQPFCKAVKPSGRIYLLSQTTAHSSQQTNPDVSTSQQDSWEGTQMFTKSQTGAFLHAPTVQRIRRHRYLPQSCDICVMTQANCTRFMTTGTVPPQSQEAHGQAGLQLYPCEESGRTQALDSIYFEVLLPLTNPNPNNHHFILFPSEFSTLDLIYS